MHISRFFKQYVRPTLQEVALTAFKSALLMLAQRAATQALQRLKDRLDTSPESEATTNTTQHDTLSPD